MNCNNLSHIIFKICLLPALLAVNASASPISDASPASTPAPSSAVKKPNWVTVCSVAVKKESGYCERQGGNERESLDSYMCDKYSYLKNTHIYASDNRYTTFNNGSMNRFHSQITCEPAKNGYTCQASYGTVTNGVRRDYGDTVTEPGPQTDGYIDNITSELTRSGAYDRVNRQELYKVDPPEIDLGGGCKKWISAGSFAVSADANTPSNIEDAEEKCQTACYR